MLKHFLGLCLASLVLAGCVTVSPRSVPINEVRNWKITKVDVSGSEVIHSWPAQEKIYIDQSKISDDEAKVVSSKSVQAHPGMRAHAQAALQQLVSSELRNALAADLNGSVPVTAIVRVKTFDVPSVVMRLLSESNAKFEAQIDIADPKSGRILLSYPGTLTLQNIGGGIGGLVIGSLIFHNDIAATLMRRNFSAYREWLVAQ